jgi:hypothetical protein
MTPRRWARLLALLVATQAVAIAFPWSSWVMIVAAVIGFAWSWRAAAKAVYRADRVDRPAPPVAEYDETTGLHLRRRGLADRAWDVVQHRDGAA